MKMPGKFGGLEYRYAYQGQEKDGETGFEAFELRQWDGRIGRWMTTDPYGQYASPYLGMGNNPISMIDPDGGYSWFGGWIRNGFSTEGLSQNSTGEWGYLEGEVLNGHFEHGEFGSTDMMLDMTFNYGDNISASFDLVGTTAYLMSGLNNFNLHNPLGTSFFEKRESPIRIYDNIIATTQIQEYTSYNLGGTGIHKIEKVNGHSIHSLNANFGVGSMSVALGSFNIAVGQTTEVSLGLNTKGVVFGYANKYGKSVHGFEVSVMPKPTLLFAPLTLFSSQPYFGL